MTRELKIEIARVKNERGAALLTVLIAVMIISILILEFQYSAILERKLAYNELNQLQAYYLAKSGVRIGTLRLGLFARTRNNKELQQQAQGMDIKPYLESIWSLPLPTFPPDSSKLGKLLKVDKDAAEQTLEQTMVSDGQFTHVITSEGAKINLNHLVVPQAQLGQPINFKPPAKTPYEHTAIMLINLLENFIKESDNPYEEYDNMKPEEIVYNIMDWINPGQQSFYGNNKDAFYEQQNPPYKAKRNLFYSLDELKLVKGIDDHLFNKLRPHITVYSRDGKININTASPTVIRALYADFTEDDMKRLFEEKTRRGGSWTDEKSFVDFITQTLGRTSFGSQYATAADYPFTVGSQSFMIESMGVLRKSKSQVQKVIRVGLALVTTKKNVSNLPQPECVKDPANFWDTRFPPGQCRNKPTNQSECRDTLAGQWIEATRTCKVNLLPDLVAPAPAATPGTATAGTGAGGTAAAATTNPNALKLLYWSET